MCWSDPVLCHLVVEELFVTMETVKYNCLLWPNMLLGVSESLKVLVWTHSCVFVFTALAAPSNGKKSPFFK